MEKALPKIWIMLATGEANPETESHGEPCFVGFPAHRATYAFCHVVSEPLGCTMSSGLRQLKARRVLGAGITIVLFPALLETVLVYMVSSSPASALFLRVSTC